MAEPLVAVLLLNWRQAEATLRCLADLGACGYARTRVLLIDNGSQDGSAARFAQAAPAAETLALAENVGYCAAMNEGLAWARRGGAELVLFLNNDVRLPAGFLPPLVDVLVHAPDVAGVMPTLLRDDGLVWSQGARVRCGPNLVELVGQGRAPAPATRGPQETGFLPGACALYRRSDLEAAGGIDASYFMYFEDAALGSVLRRQGKKLLWLPWVRAVHAAGLSSGGGRSPLRKLMMGVNSVRYLRAHGTVSLWAAFWLFEVLLWPLTLLSGTPPRSALAKLRGIVRGLCGGRVSAADVRGIP